MQSDVLSPVAATPHRDKAPGLPPAACEARDEFAGPDDGSGVTCVTTSASALSSTAATVASPLAGHVASGAAAPSFASFTAGSLQSCPFLSLCAPASVASGLPPAEGEAAAAGAARVEDSFPAAAVGPLSHPLAARRLVPSAASFAPAPPSSRLPPAGGEGDACPVAASGASGKGNDELAAAHFEGRVAERRGVRPPLGSAPPLPPLTHPAAHPPPPSSSRGDRAVHGRQFAATLLRVPQQDAHFPDLVASSPSSQASACSASSSSSFPPFHDPAFFSQIMGGAAGAGEMYYGQPAFGRPPPGSAPARPPPPQAATGGDSGCDDGEGSALSAPHSASTSASLTGEGSGREARAASSSATASADARSLGRADSAARGPAPGDVVGQVPQLPSLFQHPAPPLPHLPCTPRPAHGAGGPSSASVLASASSPFPSFASPLAHTAAPGAGLAARGGEGRAPGAPPLCGEFASPRALSASPVSVDAAVPSCLEALGSLAGPTGAGGLLQGSCALPRQTPPPGREANPGFGGDKLLAAGAAFSRGGCSRAGGVAGGAGDGLQTSSLGALPQATGGAACFVSALPSTSASPPAPASLTSLASPGAAPTPGHGGDQGVARCRGGGGFFSFPPPSAAPAGCRPPTGSLPPSSSAAAPGFPDGAVPFGASYASCHLSKGPPASPCPSSVSSHPSRLLALQASSACEAALPGPEAPQPSGSAGAFIGSSHVAASAPRPAPVFCPSALAPPLRHPMFSCSASPSSADATMHPSHLLRGPCAGSGCPSPHVPQQSASAHAPFPSHQASFAAALPAHGQSLAGPPGSATGAGGAPTTATALCYHADPACGGGQAGSGGRGSQALSPQQPTGSPFAASVQHAAAHLIPPNAGLAAAALSALCSAGLNPGCDLWHAKQVLCQRESRPLRLSRFEMVEAYAKSTLCLSCDSMEHKITNCPFGEFVCPNCHRSSHRGEHCPLPCRFCFECHSGISVNECIRRTARQPLERLLGVKMPLDASLCRSGSSGAFSCASADGACRSGRWTAEDLSQHTADRPNTAHGRSVYVSNMVPGTTKEALRTAINLLLEHGYVLSVEMRERSNLQPYAFVELSTLQAAYELVQQKKTALVIRDQQLKVQFKKIGLTCTSSSRLLRLPSAAGAPGGDAAAAAAVYASAGWLPDADVNGDDLSHARAAAGDSQQAQQLAHALLRQSTEPFLPTGQSVHEVCRLVAIKLAKDYGLSSPLLLDAMASSCFFASSARQTGVVAGAAAQHPPPLGLPFASWPATTNALALAPPPQPAQPSPGQPHAALQASVAPFAFANSAFGSAVAGRAVERVDDEPAGGFPGGRDRCGGEQRPVDFANAAVATAVRSAPPAPFSAGGGGRPSGASPPSAPASGYPQASASYAWQAHASAFASPASLSSSSSIRQPPHAGGRDLGPASAGHAYPPNGARASLPSAASQPRGCHDSTLDSSGASGNDGGELRDERAGFAVPLAALTPEPRFSASYLPGGGERGAFSPPHAASTHATSKDAKKGGGLHPTTAESALSRGFVGSSALPFRPGGAEKVAQTHHETAVTQSRSAALAHSARASLALDSERLVGASDQANGRRSHDVERLALEGQERGPAAAASEPRGDALCAGVRRTEGAGVAGGEGETRGMRKAEGEGSGLRGDASHYECLRRDSGMQKFLSDATEYVQSANAHLTTARSTLPSDGNGDSSDKTRNSQIQSADASANREKELFSMYARSEARAHSFAGNASGRSAAVSWEAESGSRGNQVQAADAATAARFTSFSSFPASLASSLPSCTASLGLPGAHAAAGAAGERTDDSAGTRPSVYVHRSPGVLAPAAAGAACSYPFSCEQREAARPPLGHLRDEFGAKGSERSARKGSASNLAFVGRVRQPPHTPPPGLELRGGGAVAVCQSGGPHASAAPEFPPFLSFADQAAGAGAPSRSRRSEEGMPQGDAAGAGGREGSDGRDVDREAGGDKREGAGGTNSQKAPQRGGGGKSASAANSRDAERGACAGEEGSPALCSFFLSASGDGGSSLDGGGVVSEGPATPKKLPSLASRPTQLSFFSDASSLGSSSLSLASTGGVRHCGASARGGEGGGAHASRNGPANGLTAFSGVLTPRALATTDFEDAGRSARSLGAEFHHLSLSQQSTDEDTLPAQSELHLSFLSSSDLWGSARSTAEEERMFADGARDDALGEASPSRLLSSSFSSFASLSSSFSSASPLPFVAFSDQTASSSLSTLPALTSQAEGAAKRAEEARCARAEEKGCASPSLDGGGGLQTPASEEGLCRGERRDDASERRGDDARPFDRTRLTGGKPLASVWVEASQEAPAGRTAEETGLHFSCFAQSQGGVCGDEALGKSRGTTGGGAVGHVSCASASLLVPLSLSTGSTEEEDESERQAASQSKAKTLLPHLLADGGLAPHLDESGKSQAKALATPFLPLSCRGYRRPSAKGDGTQVEDGAATGRSRDPREDVENAEQAEERAGEEEAQENTSTAWPLSLRSSSCSSPSSPSGSRTGDSKAETKLQLGDAGGTPASLRFNVKLEEALSIGDAPDAGGLARLHDRPAATVASSSNETYAFCFSSLASSSAFSSSAETAGSKGEPAHPIGARRGGPNGGDRVDAKGLVLQGGGDTPGAFAFPALLEAPQQTWGRAPEADRPAKPSNFASASPRSVFPPKDRPSPSAVFALADRCPASILPQHETTMQRPADASPGASSERRAGAGDSAPTLKAVKRFHEAKDDGKSAGGGVGVPRPAPSCPLALPSLLSHRAAHQQGLPPLVVSALASPSCCASAASHSAAFPRFAFFAAAAGEDRRQAREGGGEGAGPPRGAATLPRDGENESRAPRPEESRRDSASAHQTTEARAGLEAPEGDGSTAQMSDARAWATETPDEAARARASPERAAAPEARGRTSERARHVHARLRERNAPGESVARVEETGAAAGGQEGDAVSEGVVSVVVRRAFVGLRRDDAGRRRGGSDAACAAFASESQDGERPRAETFELSGASPSAHRSVPLSGASQTPRHAICSQPYVCGFAACASMSGPADECEGWTRPGGEVPSRDCDEVEAAQDVGAAAARSKFITSMPDVGCGVTVAGGSDEEAAGRAGLLCEGVAARLTRGESASHDLEERDKAAGREGDEAVAAAGAARRGPRRHTLRRKSSEEAAAGLGEADTSSAGGASPHKGKARAVDELAKRESDAAGGAGAPAAVDMATLLDRIDDITRQLPPSVLDAVLSGLSSARGPNAPADN
ncbi:hypothetical protein BESB_072550 [Besnoitia besnoiti]|uniref:RRM domain-containing protein n=1 Tax=Besnoitia besnoiti TaxID=94643 RepID=A0A2A9MEJ9_BESBE|nr:uncharacterized protein BESB_072550 [Besnoitia besnoiti]PFH34103.1 hypothetical protein BESB_072550 [Besnoitia besnoiti]